MPLDYQCTCYITAPVIMWLVMLQLLQCSTFNSKISAAAGYCFFTLIYPECSVPPEKGLQLLGRLSLVGEDELQKVNGLPNQHNSSDHLPLLTHFRLHPRVDGWQNKSVWEYHKAFWNVCFIPKKMAWLSDYLETVSNKLEAKEELGSYW